MNGSVRVIVQYVRQDGEGSVSAERSLASEELNAAHYPRHTVGALARQAFDDLVLSPEYGS